MEFIRKFSIEFEETKSWQYPEIAVKASWGPTDFHNLEVQVTNRQHANFPYIGVEIEQNDKLQYREYRNGKSEFFFCIHNREVHQFDPVTIRIKLGKTYPQASEYIRYKAYRKLYVSSTEV